MNPSWEGWLEGSWLDGSWLEGSASECSWLEGSWLDGSWIEGSWCPSEVTPVAVSSQHMGYTSVKIPIEVNLDRIRRKREDEEIIIL